MSKRNLTISIDSELTRKAKVLAAKRRESISGLIRGLIDELVRRDEAYEAARRSALRRLKKGSRLGGASLPEREELHGRGQVR